MQSSPVVLLVKKLPANVGDGGDGFDSWVGKIPWRRAWQPTPVFLSGDSLVGYRPWPGLQSCNLFQSCGYC